MKITIEVPDPESPMFVDGPAPALEPVAVTMDLPTGHRLTFTADMPEPITLDMTGNAADYDLSSLLGQRLALPRLGTFDIHLTRVRNLMQIRIPPPEDCQEGDDDAPE